MQDIQDTVFIASSSCRMHPQFQSPKAEIFLNVSPQFSHLKQCNKKSMREGTHLEQRGMSILHGIKSAPLDGPHVP